MSPAGCAVILFESVNAAMLAEKLLRDAGMAIKLIPVPKRISSDCGVCIRVDTADLDSAQGILAQRVKVQAVVPLP